MAKRIYGQPNIWSTEYMDRRVYVFIGRLAVFELETGSHHDHIVCVQCGHIEEFMDQTIENHQHKIAESRGFEITDHSLIIYGRCNRKNCPGLKN